MRFLLIMAHDEKFKSDQGLIESIFEWIDNQSQAGVRVMGAPLMPPGEARTVRHPGAEAEISPGPFTAGPLHTAAVEMIECEDIDQAVAIASTHPMAKRATIEQR